MSKIFGFFREVKKGSFLQNFAPQGRVPKNIRALGKILAIFWPKFDKNRNFQKIKWFYFGGWLFHFCDKKNFGENFPEISGKIFSAPTPEFCQTSAGTSGESSVFGGCPGGVPSGANWPRRPRPGKFGAPVLQKISQLSSKKINEGELVYPVWGVKSFLTEIFFCRKISGKIFAHSRKISSHTGPRRRSNLEGYEWGILGVRGVFRGVFRGCSAG